MMANSMTNEEIIQELGLTGIDVIKCNINPTPYISKLTNLVKINKKGRKPNNDWTDCTLRFATINYQYERVQMRICYNSKEYSLGNCYLNQKEEAINYFENIKKEFSNKDIEFVKTMMKNKFSIKKTKSKKSKATKVTHKKTVCVICGKTISTNGSNKYCSECKSRYTERELLVMGRFKQGIWSKEDFDEIQELYNKGLTISQISRKKGVGFKTYITDIINLYSYGVFNEQEELNAPKTVKKSVKKVKTSFYIDEDLLKEVKHRAVDEKTNSTGIITQSLKEYLAKSDDSQKESTLMNDFTTDRYDKLYYKGEYTGLVYLDLLDLANYYHNYDGRIGRISRLYPIDVNKIALKVLLQNVENNEICVLFKKLEKDCNELKKTKINKRR